MKISDYIVFTCKKCKRRINPYGEGNLIGFSVEEALRRMNNCYSCPDCGEVHCWEFYQ